MEQRAIYEAAGLELRRRGKRPVIAGRFPYKALAVIADRGKVRKERILPGAFSFTLEDAKREINLLFGHDFDKPLASRSTGSLTLTDTPDALDFEAEIAPELEAVGHVRDALAMLESGLVTGLSPGFRVPPKDVVPNAERLVPEEGNEGVFIRELGALLLFELSLVTRPAYEEAQAELRAMQQATHPVRQQRIWLP